MVNMSKSTALHLAVSRGYLESAKLLIQADPTKDLLRMVDQNGNTALHIAVENHNFGLVNLLVEADPDYEYCLNVYYNTPISEGDERKVEIRKLLIEKQSQIFSIVVLCPDSIRSSWLFVTLGGVPFYFNGSDCLNIRLLD